MDRFCVCVCVCDSVGGSSELASRFQKCLTDHEAGCGGQGPLGLVFLEGFSGRVLGIWWKAHVCRASVESDSRGWRHSDGCLAGGWAKRAPFHWISVGLPHLQAEDGEAPCRNNSC